MSRPLHALAMAALMAIIFATCFFGSPTHAASSCEDLFRITTERGRLVTLASRYYSVPIAERAQFRDPAYTEIAQATLADLEASYARTQKSILSRGLWFSRRKTHLRVARAYLDLLQQHALKKTQDGDMTAVSVIQLGHHASWLYDLIDDRFTIRGISSAFVENTARGYFTENSTMGRRDFFRELSAVPTSKWYSHEGVIELLAHGMRIYGVYKDTPEGRDSRNYYQHDHTHALDWNTQMLAVLEYPYTRAPGSSAQRSYRDPADIKDISESVVYKRIHDRLRTIVERLKSLPKKDRDAGFALAFYLFHERPEKYLGVLAMPQRLSPRYFMPPARGDTNKEPDYFLRRIGDVDDLGISFPQRTEHGFRVVIDSREIVARAYKAFAFAISDL